MVCIDCVYVSLRSELAKLPGIGRRKYIDLLGMVQLERNETGRFVEWPMDANFMSEPGKRWDLQVLATL